MKKFGIALMASLLGMGLVACSDPEKLKNGEACTESTECESNYCAEDGKCADQPNADDQGAACSETEPCTDANEYCGAEGKCVAKKGADATCAADVECKSGDCSEEGKCVGGGGENGGENGGNEGDKTPVDGEACDTQSIACMGKNLVECTEDDKTPGELTWKVTACADACLDLENAEPACYTACDEENKKTVKCDPESGEDGDSLKASIELTCTVVGDGKYEIVTNRTECEGMYTCDTSTGVCETAGAGSTGKQNGETCEVAGDCLSSYCDDTTKKCADKPSDKKANGETCTDANDCQSGYCNGTTCADMPVASGAACTTKANCTETEICGAEYACTIEEGKVGLGDACDETNVCAKDLACDAEKNVCILEVQSVYEGQTCEAGEKAACYGVALVSCEESWNYEEEGKYNYAVTVCALKNSACVSYEDKAKCYEICDTADATKVLCDTENVNGKEGKVTYTCKEVEGKLLFVPTGYEACQGAATCDMDTGTARCL